MPKIKKRTPVMVPSEMERPINQIYDDINDIINSVNNFSLSAEEFAGKLGDLRIVKEQQAGGTSKYYFQFKTEDGWVQIEGTPVSG